MDGLNKAEQILIDFQAAYKKADFNVVAELAAAAGFNKRIEIYFAGRPKAFREREYNVEEQHSS